MVCGRRITVDQKVTELVKLFSAGLYIQPLLIMQVTVIIIYLTAWLGEATPFSLKQRWIYSL